MELVEELASRADMTKRGAGEALDTILEIIADALGRGEKVTITGFGTYLVRHRAARMGRNPQTGEPLHIAAQDTPAFRAGTALKDAVKKGGW